MKKVLLLPLIAIVAFAQLASAKTIEVEVHGLTCALCVDSLNRAFKEMEDVSKVEVSMKMKKIRLETESESPSIEKIKQTILNAGFTPTKVTVLADENVKPSQ
jgi:Cu+-exporting ATPase